MKIMFLTSILLVNSFYALAFPFPDGNHVSNEAFACKDCNLIEAEEIARNNAPSNTCDIYRNGSNASYCEAVSKEVLIPVHNTREVFKFYVTTSINSQNIAVVNVTSSPITPIQNELMTDYLKLYSDIQQAVNSASIASSELSPMPVFTTNATAQNTAKSDEECDSHPTFYFRGLSEKRQIRNDIGNRILNRIGPNSAVEYSHEALVNGGSLEIGKDGVGVSVNLQYVKNDLIAFRGDDFNNRLAFTVVLGTDALTEDAKFSLELNTRFTKIDGLKYSELFGGGEANLINVTVSICLIDFLDNNAEQDDAIPPFGGGDGSSENPFFDASIGSGGFGDFCRFRQKYKTCKTEPDGSQSCTLSTVEYISRCDSLSNP